MGIDFLESRRGTSVENRDRRDAPSKERRSAEHDEFDTRGSDEVRDSGKYRSKDKSISSSRREEKDHKSRGRERSRERERENDDSVKDRSSGRDRKREERDEREKDKVRDTVSEKDADRDKLRENERYKERKDRGKERDRVREKENEIKKEVERSRDKERGKEKSRDKDKDREKESGRAKDGEQEKHKDRERGKGRDRGKDAVEREKGKERNREKEKQLDQAKDKARDRDRSNRKQKDDSHDRIKDVEGEHHSKFKTDFTRDNQFSKEVNDNSDNEDDSEILKNQKNTETGTAGSHESALKLEERISRMREERLKKSSEGATEVLAWVNRSRKLEDKRNAEKEKALQFSRVLEEQDNINNEESDDEETTEHTTANLGGVKVLHGIDKVLEGGAIVLTLKDQSILADGDVNEEVDMLENVEIGEQKRRDEAYRAAKKKSSVYDDKFNDEPGMEKKMLPQYDDPVVDEGVTLDSSGHFTGEAEKKLEELRKRIQGISGTSYGENLNSTGKTSTDYLTQEEMMKFNKPTKKKKKSLRKKEKLDLNALEAEALSTGLGAGDLGSRNSGRRQNLKEEQDRIEAELRSNAYQSAYAKADEASKALLQGQVHTIKTEEDDTNADQSVHAEADEASKALRQGQVHSIKTEEDDTDVFGDDDDELRKSLERARKVALRKQEEKSGLQMITLLAASTARDATVENPNVGSGEQQENKVVFTEMEEFVWGLQHDEETQKPGSEDVFMEEDVAPVVGDEEMKDEDGGWTEVKETMEDEIPVKEEEKEVVPDETIHESAVGKGLAGALKLLKDRGTLKETIEWGGRNMDKKKSKLVGIYENDGKKEIRIERTDEYGRILTPKEAFRLLSHRFHGKGPGKTKQERYQRQYQEELKVKQMENADTPSLSVARMRDAQEKLQTPYLVLSGNVKLGQSSSDPRSGFTTVDKDFAGGLTPMLGDKKVEHFLNIKRKAEPGDSSSQKKVKI